MIKQCDGNKLELSCQRLEQLQEYAQQLIAWNGLSLIGKSTHDDVFGWHINDALSIFNIVQQIAQDRPGITFVDFGAGGGILGVSLAIAGIENIALVERSETKANFLKNIVKFKRVHSSCNDVYSSCNDISDANEICLLVRGVSSMTKTLQAANLESITHAVFLKACDTYSEMREAKRSWYFAHKMYPRVARAAGKVMALSGISKKG